MLVGYAMATEPDFIAPGDSYKPHSLTISSIFFALGLSVYFIIMRYQRKVIELNEKFALIGKQSSFLMHEIKNPLNRVVANSSHEFSTELMEDIRRDSQKISGLVSSIETLIHHPEQLTRTFVRFDLSETKDNLLKEYDQYAKSMNITLELNELQGSFYGNKYLIYQLIKNMILNAIEAIGYRKDESCLIKVSALKDEKDLNLTVTNTGSSITTRDLGLIFEPHFTTKKNRSNKGLGLTLAKSIVEAHFGKISVYSTENSVSIQSLIPDKNRNLTQGT
jgi:signal transduction histidine kinase